MKDFRVTKMAKENKSEGFGASYNQKKFSRDNYSQKM